MGCLRGRPPSEPKKGAVPKLKMPPSEATRKYPAPFGPVIMPMTGLFSTRLPVLPWNCASP